MSSTPVLPDPRDAAPLAHRVVRGGALTAIGSYLSVGFGFVANLFLTRILLPDHFGIVSIATFYYSLLNLRPKLSVGLAYARDRQLGGAEVGTHLWIEVATGVISLVLTLVGAPLVAHLYSTDAAYALVGLAIAGLLESITSTAWVSLDKELRLGRSSLVSTIVFPISYIPAFVLALNGGGFWSLIAQAVAYAALLALGQWVVFRRTLPQVFQQRWHFDRVVAIRYLKFGLPLGLATLASVTIFQFDNFLIGTFVGVETLGFYERAYRTAQWPIMLVSPIVTRAALYTYARLQDDPTRLSKSLDMTMWVINVAALPIAAAVFTTAPDLIRWLYGERWLASAVFLRWLIVFSVIRPLLDNAGSLFIAVKDLRGTLIVQLGQAATLIVAGLILTAIGGAIGTVLAVGLAFAVGLVLTFRRLRRVVSISLSNSLFLPGLGALVAIGVYAMSVRVLPLSTLALPLVVAFKAALTLMVFYGTILLVRRAWLIDRIRYIWRLLRP
ncbi:MAG: oligosaccharide flippase family protein [Anaerolineae bacterium]